MLCNAMKKYLTISQTAEILNVSAETLRRWDKSGKFQSSRNPINNYRVYSEEQVVTFVKDMQLALSYSPQQDSKEELEPFLSTDYGQLYHFDAIEFLRQLESNSIDLIFADPPYNIKKAVWDKFSSQKEYLDWSLEWISESHRVLKKTGSLFVCGFSEILADIKYTTSHLFKGCKWLVWFYRNKANLGNDWGRSHESIIHLRKSNKYIFNIDEIRIPYNEHTLKYPKRTQADSSQYSNGNKKNYIWEPNPLGAKPKDVLEIPTISNGSWEKYPHQTQKPVELLRKIILSASDNESIIFDPFGGSGTTYAVAEAYNRKWLGTELDINYCMTIKERLNDRVHLNRILSANDEMESKLRRKILRG